MTWDSSPRRKRSLGFAVYVGGGMGADSRVGQLFEPFVPADQIHLVAEAVKRVFDQHGNRKNRNKARLRFLIEQIGLPRFRELYERELDLLRIPTGGSPSPPPSGPAAGGSYRAGSACCGLCRVARTEFGPATARRVFPGADPADVGRH